MADPVFLITGASSGIGLATAKRAIEADYRLVLAARSVDKLEAIAAELGGGRDRVLPVQCDVTEWSAQEAMASTALERFGRLDVVFANAGIGAERGFLESTPERWRTMVLTNVFGAALTIRATLGALQRSKGHFLLTGSVAGRKGVPGSLYSSTKWAITGMADSLRAELDGTGVRVSLIEPGFVDTPFYDSPPPGALLPDDVARAVMFAITQPPEVNVNEILVRPITQSF